MHPALPAAQLTIVKGHRRHGRAWSLGVSRQSSIICWEGGRTVYWIGCDMLDPTCFICFHVSKTVQSDMFQNVACHMFHCSATGGYPHTHIINNKNISQLARASQPMRSGSLDASTRTVKDGRRRPPHFLARENSRQFPNLFKGKNARE